MPRYTEEQIARANETDLVSFLRARGEKLKKSGKEYRWMKHDSLTVDHNEWYRFSGSKGGHPIDFLMEFYNMSFPEAVKTLINESPGENKQEVKKMEQEDAGSHEGSHEGCPIPSEKAKLQLPKAYENNDRVREYLIKERKISEKIIDQMLAEGKIYEDAVKHNVIFIGCDPKGTVRYAGIRGTKEKYRGDAPGSEKAYGFSHTGTDDTLFVFEAPIDLLSFLSATGDGWETHHYISLGGVSEYDLDNRLDPVGKNITVNELVDRYLATKTGVKYNTQMNYKFVKNILKTHPFGDTKISRVKTSDAKLFLIKLQQEDGRGYSSVKTIRGVLRPAFQMAVDDDVLNKNPFGFQLAGVVVNDSVTREAITKEQMNKFLKFVHDDNVYCKYYEVIYILFHTGMRISEFCGLTISDIDLENNIVNIDHQLQRTSDMKYILDTTKTDAGTRKLPIT